MKKFILLAGVATLLTLGCICESRAKTCDCGSTENGGSASDCCWEIVDGVLSISGTGKMKNYAAISYGELSKNRDNQNLAPWALQIDDIKSVEITGVENVGEGTLYFAGSKEIPIKLDNSIKRIENYALKFNTPVLEIPDSVTYIGEEAFNANISVPQTIIIPDTITRIGNYMFGYSTNQLYNINIVCKGEDCDRVKKLFEEYKHYTGVKHITLDLSDNVVPANDTNCDSANYYWSGKTCARRNIDGSINCADGYAEYKNKCWFELPFAKKRWTPAEANEWLHDGNDNFVVITFKK